MIRMKLDTNTYLEYNENCERFCIVLIEGADAQVTHLSTEASKRMRECIEALDTLVEMEVWE